MLDTQLAHFGYVDQLCSSTTKQQFVDYTYQSAAEESRKAQAQFESWAAGLQLNWTVAVGEPVDVLRRTTNTGDHELVWYRGSSAAAGLALPSTTCRSQSVACPVRYCASSNRFFFNLVAVPVTCYIIIGSAGVAERQTRQT